MKATGIVRRIDELGRVVIPKEIRRTQRIRPSDPLEIFTTGDGEVIFRKYSPVAELSTHALETAEVLARSLGQPVLVCDRDHVVSAAGATRRELEGRRVSHALEKLMQGRRLYTWSGESDRLYPCEGASRQLVVGMPILAAGDVIGAVCALAGAAAHPPTGESVALTQLCAALLARQMEG